MTRKSDLVLRTYHPRDLPEITGIYAHYVDNSVVSFDLDAPDQNHMKEKLKVIYRARRPLIIATIDEKIVGYAYASTYRTRPAYRFTCEHAIYLHPEYTGQGLGSILMEELISRSTDFGYNQMIAIITMGAKPYDGQTQGSIALHKKFGFEILGEFPELGYKFDQWHGVTHMQKKL